MRTRQTQIVGAGLVHNGCVCLGVRQWVLRHRFQVQCEGTPGSDVPLCW